MVWFREILSDGLAAFFLSVGWGPRAVKALVISHGHLEKNGEVYVPKSQALVRGHLAFKWQSRGMTLEHPCPWAVRCESAGQPDLAIYHIQSSLCLHVARRQSGDSDLKPLLLTDSKGLSNPAEVEALREKVYASLEAYCKHKYPEQPGR